MMYDFKGKKVLVTGSTQGIGKALAEAFAACGATVFVNGATSLEKVERVCAGIPGSVPAFCNLADPDCAQKLYAITGELDFLVLNASIQLPKNWAEITPDEMELQLAVNFKAGISLIQKYAAGMRERGFGRIVTIGSVQQARPHKDMLIYAASKCAMLSVVRSLAKQLAPDGITINNVAPGVINTPRAYDALRDPKYAAQVLESIPVGFYGEAEDCVGQVLLLCSDEGRYITGADIFIDGGMAL